MHRQVDDIWRIDYQLRAGRGHRARPCSRTTCSGFVQKHLDAIGEGHLPWETVWTSVYRAGAMTLEATVTAGCCSPAMPRMPCRSSACAGSTPASTTADNLAWKLALRGARAKAATIAAGQLFAGADRCLPHQRRQARCAAPSSCRRPRAASTCCAKPRCRWLQAHRGIAALINPRQTEAVSYPDSPLSTPDRSGLAGPAPGTLLADFKLQAPAGHLTQLLGPGFALIAFSEDGPPDAGMTAAVSAAMQESAIPLQCILVSPPAAGTTLPPAPWQCATADPQVLRMHSSDAVIALYLLRPDRHIAARWRAGVSSPAHGGSDQPLAASLAAAIRRAACIVPVAAATHFLEN